MKFRILHLLSIVALGTLLFSCVKDETLDPQKPEELPVLTVSETEFRAGVKGGMFVSELDCPLQLQITEPDWCEVSLIHNPELSSSGALKIIVSKNEERNDRTGEIILSAEGCDPVTITIFQSSRELSSTNNLSSLSFTKMANPRIQSDIQFKYDKATNTFSAMYLKWIEGENPEKIIPTFRTDGYEVFANGSKVISGVTAVDFSDDIEFEVYAENGDKKTYKVSFNCPQINTEIAVLHMKPNKLIDSKDFYVSTEIELYDKSKESTNDGWWDSKIQGPIEMKRRGNSTWGLPKKPFRMKFPVKCSPIGFNHTSERNWVLLAQDMDKSLLRTYLAFQYSDILLTQDAAYHDPKASLFTPHTKYVNVYMTGPYFDSSQHRTVQMEGDYLGLYQMCDHLDRGKGRLDIEPLTALDGGNQALITGGYLLEADLHDGRYTTARKGIKFTYKYPKDDDHSPEQYDYISRYLNEAENVLYSSNYQDPVNGWRKYFDEKTLADYIIIKELVGDMDGYTSTYIYKKRGCDKFFFGPIWDCDKGWKNDVRTPHYEYPPDRSLMIYAGFWMPPYVHHDWFQRFWEDPTFRKFVNQRWKSKKDALLAVTEQVLTEMPEKMKKSIQANFTVWPFNYQYSSEAARPQKDYQTEIKYISKLTQERARLLDKEFAK